VPEREESPAAPEGRAEEERLTRLLPEGIGEELEAGVVAAREEQAARRQRGASGRRSVAGSRSAARALLDPLIEEVGGKQPLAGDPARRNRAALGQEIDR